MSAGWELVASFRRRNDASRLGEGVEGFYIPILFKDPSTLSGRRDGTGLRTEFEHLALELGCLNPRLTIESYSWCEL